MALVMKRSKFNFVAIFGKTVNIKIKVPVTPSSHSTWKITIDVQQEREINSYGFSGYGRGTVKGTSDNFHDRSFCKIEFIKTSSEQTIILAAPSHNKFKFRFKVAVSKYRCLFSLTLGSCYESDFKPLSFKKLLDAGSFTDTFIKTKEETFPCHKLVLAAESEYFKAMFLSDFKENEEIVVDWCFVFDASTVRDLLHYLYTLETPPNIKQTCQQLLEAACLCLLDQLKEKCVLSVIPKISVENATNLVQMAELHNLENLKEPLVDFITKNYEEVAETEAWMNLSPDVVKRHLGTVYQHAKNSRNFR